MAHDPTIAFERNRRLWDDRVAIHRRDATGFYRVASMGAACIDCTTGIPGCLWRCR